MLSLKSGTNLGLFSACILGFFFSRDFNEELSISEIKKSEIEFSRSTVDWTLGS